jgi:hypothetical protein
MAANKNEQRPAAEEGSGHKAPWTRPTVRKLRAGAAELAVGTIFDNVDRRS